MKEINRSEVFSTMLQELPWSSLKGCLQVSAPVMKKCTAGGHRLDVKSRKRVEKVLLQHMEKEDFPESIYNVFFAYWYPMQGELHDKLEEHFHSDDYKKSLAERELEPNSYVLTDQEFDTFFNVSDLQKWRGLLCFSPLQFTESQAHKIVDESQGNTELLQSVTELQKTIAERDSEIARASNELTAARTRLDQLNQEVQELRKERRNLKADLETATKKSKSALRETGKLRDQIQEFKQQASQAKEAAQNELLRKTKVLSDEVQRRSKEVKSWEEKYEKQHNVNQELRKKLQKSEKILAEERIAKDKSRQEIQRVQKFTDLLLSRLDWAEIGKQIKLTPQLKLRFNSLIRNLHYDSSNKPTMNAPIEKLWSKLQAQEKKLIESIAHSDTREVETGDVQNYWRDLEDMFEDVQIGLESRTILLQLLHQIFFQTMDIKDLETDQIPTSMTKARK